MRERGVEPPRPYGHTDLNRARLPFRHSRSPPKGQPENSTTLSASTVNRGSSTPGGRFVLADRSGRYPDPPRIARRRPAHREGASGLATRGLCLVDHWRRPAHREGASGSVVRQEHSQPGRGPVSSPAHPASVASSRSSALPPLRMNGAASGTRRVGQEPRQSRGSGSLGEGVGVCREQPPGVVEGSVVDEQAVVRALAEDRRGQSEGRRCRQSAGAGGARGGPGGVSPPGVVRGGLMRRLDADHAAGRGEGVPDQTGTRCAGPAADGQVDRVEATPRGRGSAIWPAMRTPRGSPDPRCRGHLVAACADAGFEPRIAYASDDDVAIQALVAAGHGVTLLPGRALASHRHPGVRIRPVAGQVRLVRVSVAGRPPHTTAVDLVLSAAVAAWRGRPRGAPGTDSRTRPGASRGAHPVESHQCGAPAAEPRKPE